MSSLTYENLPDWIATPGGTISKADAVKAAGHVLLAQRLITGADHENFTDLDLALHRLVDFFGGDHKEFARLADDLLGAAIELEVAA